eukprot:4379994-Lingulodinium_polyedra.AAC.1
MAEAATTPVKPPKWIQEGAPIEELMKVPPIERVREVECQREAKQEPHGIGVPEIPDFPSM